MFLNRNTIVWYYDIPSAGKFLERKKAKIFNFDHVSSFVDLLSEPDDEVSIVIPGLRDSKIHISIWGKDSKSCLIERIEPRKCGSYWLLDSKSEIKTKLLYIEKLATSPTEFGLELKA